MAEPRSDESGGDEDTRLLVASRTDPRAFGLFYERNADRVVAYFYRRILSPHTSSELAAETFAQAYAARKRFVARPDTSAVAWLFGIAGNLHKVWLRRGVIADGARRRLGIVAPVLVEEDLEHIENLVDLTALRNGLRAALISLSPKLRDAVILRVALELPYQEVAEELGCTVPAARVRVSRGLDRLLVELEAR